MLSVRPLGLQPHPLLQVRHLFPEGRPNTNTTLFAPQQEQRGTETKRRIPSRPPTRTPTFAITASGPRPQPPGPPGRGDRTARRRPTTLQAACQSPSLARVGQENPSRVSKTWSGLLSQVRHVLRMAKTREACSSPWRGAMPRRHAACKRGMGKRSRAARHGRLARGLHRRHRGFRVSTLSTGVEDDVSDLH